MLHLRRDTTPVLAVFAGLAFIACAADPAPEEEAGDPPPADHLVPDQGILPDRPEPEAPLQESEMAALLNEHLGELGKLSEVEDQVEYKIFDLPLTDAPEVGADACTEIQWAASNACSAYYSLTGDYCSAQGAFFYANLMPRCAMRLTVQSAQGNELATLYAFDFVGESLSEPAPECGNGELDEGEGCDDGNHENWDGCDQNCQVEEFTGCEQVIEHYYEQAEIAYVDADLWDGPRSQVMVHPSPVALREVDTGLCSAALATGEDVCLELQQTMDFVSWCHVSGELDDSGAQPACNVRLNVYFSKLDSDSGVFTTTLPGILSFTIR